MIHISVDGVRLACLAPRGLPQPQASTVLLVHGVGGSSAQFEQLVHRLRPGVVPIALDLPGHGRSEGVVPASVDALADMVASFLSAIGVQRAACYVGHSFGGLVGLQFACRHPTRVDRLVTLASAARLRLHPDLLEQAASGRWDVGRFEPSFAAGVPAERRRAVLRDLTKLRLGPDRAALRKLGEAAAPDLSAVRVPALCVVPEEDVVLAPRHGVALAANLPDARLVRVPAAGHYVHVEQPDAVASAVNAFLATLPLPAPGRALRRTRLARRRPHQPA
jgi:pimeloyl-ACP methyl ester carboxylesterase